MHWCSRPSPNAADATVRQLTKAGHRVFRCHEPGKPEFPCRALAGDGPCPLSDPGVDVAVTVRTHPDTRPTVREDGVACALRAHVPLVVAGRVMLNPYEEWADEVVEDGDVVAACERVVSAPSRRSLRGRLRRVARGGATPCRIRR